MRSVLVTGCSSGFGLWTSVAAAKAGWRVFASMRNLDKRDRLDKAAADAGVADRVEVVQLDVTDRDSIRAAVEHVLAATNRGLEAVVHNAGVSGGGAFEEFPEEEWRRMFETNFFGVLRLTQDLLPAMRERRRGRIVLVSSDSAVGGDPGLSLYSATKYALEGWAEALAYEVEPFGIKVVVIQPGAFKTEIWDSSPRYLPGPDSPYRDFGEKVQRFVEQKLEPSARDPKEVATLIVRTLEYAKPRFRYQAGPDSKAIAVLGRLPYRARAAIVKRVLGIHRPGK